MYRVPADCFILDLEDSVPVGDKGEARERIFNLLNSDQLSSKQNNARIVVRINSPDDSLEWISDLELASDNLMGKWLGT